MSVALKNGVEDAFTRLDKERLLEISYLTSGGRTFRGDRQNFLSFLNILRKEGDSGFCDVVLEVDGESFPAHRCVLAANSHFFYTLFTSGMKDSNDKHIKLCSLSSSALSTILDFFYTRDIVINKENADELLEASSFLLLNSIKTACAVIISSSISITNCFSIKRLADRYTLDDLKKKADLYVKENFQAAKLEKDFLDLEAYELKEIISSHSLRVEREEEVFDALVNWVKHDPTTRIKDLSDLLPCLCFGSLSDDFMEEHFQNDTIFDGISFCQNFLKQQRRRRRSARPKKNRNCKERPSARIHDVVIGVGRGNLRTMFCYDIDSEQIFRLPDPPSHCFQLGVTTLGQEVYTICRDRHNWDYNGTCLGRYKLGASSGNKHVDQLWQETTAPLLRPNACYDRTIILNLKNKLYVVGGCVDYQQANSRLVDIQCFDANEFEWKALARMNTPRCSLGAIATSTYIYAIGGKKGHSNAAEKIVERFNPELNEWATMAEMSYPRASPQVVATSSGIFVIGGISAFSDSHFCEIYKESSNKWTLIAALPEKIPKISLTWNDEVYVISGGQSLKYSKKKGLWKKSPMFRALQNGLEDYHFVQLKIPKFHYDQYCKIGVNSLVRYDRSFYECSSDEDDDSDFHDPLFFWGDDSSGSDW